MIEISISSELAAQHSEFMAGRAERGQHVEVFDDSETGHPAPPDPAGRQPARSHSRRGPVFAGGIAPPQPQREEDPIC
jgi:hypothetical protein